MRRLLSFLAPLAFVFVIFAAKPATAQPTLTRFPTGSPALTFATATGTTSLPQIIQIENTGGIGTTLNITAVTTSDLTQFQIVDQTCTNHPLIKVLVNNSTTCMILVSYKPSDGVGPDNANVDITSDTGGVAGTHTLIPITGNPSGGTSLAAVPNLVAFQAQGINTVSAARNIEIRNTGSTAITAVTVSALGGSNPADFSIFQDNCSGQTLNPTSSCLIMAKFNPTSATAALSSTFTVGGTSSPVVTPITVTLTGDGVQPTITVGPAAVPFGSVQVGTTTAPQTVTVTNTSSTADLHIGNLQQADPTHFIISSDTCSGATVAMGGANTCTFDVSFHPTSAIAFNDSVVIPNDSATPSASVTLSGTGEVASIISNGPVSFSNIPVGTTAGPATVIVTNTSSTSDLHIGNLQQIGADTAQFSIVNDTCSGATILAGGANTCTFDVTFHPGSASSFSDTVLVPNDSSSPNFTVGVTGTSVLPVLLPDGAVSFGSIAVGTASNHTVTVQNTSVFADLHIGTLTKVGVDTTQFSIINDGCSNQTVIANNGTCTFDVSFHPTVAGSFSDSVSIPSDAASSPDTVGVSGSGETGTIGSSGPVTFLNVPINTTSAPQTVTITNSDIVADLHIGNLAKIGADTTEFAIVNDQCSNQTVAANNGTCTFQVTFSPTTAASASDTVLVPNDSSGTPNLTVALSGTPEVANASSDGDVSFGSIQVGTTTTPVTVTITNNGAFASLHIGNLTKIGVNTTNFAIVSDQCSNVTVAPAGTCTFGVTFSPTSATTFNDTVLVPNDSDNDPNLTVDLDGEGVVGTISSNGPISFGTVGVNDFSVATVTISNTSLVADLHIGNLQNIGTNANNFSILNDNCSGQTVVADSDCTFDVRFTPDSATSFSDTILVPNDSSPGFTVALSGDGESPTIDTSGDVSFGGVAIGTTSDPITVTITNDDQIIDLHIGNLIKIGANANLFTIVNDNCSNQDVDTDGGTCTFDVIFSPTATGDFTDAVLIPNNANGQEIVNLDGTGVAAGLTSSGSGAFGIVLVGATGGPNTITVTNTSSTSSVNFGNLQQIGANPNEFTVENDNCSGKTVAPNGSCTFQATFHPSVAGSLTDKILIPNDSANPNFSVNLSGTGVVPGVALATFNPTVLDYDLTLPATGGASESQTTTVTNVGANPLQIQQVSIDGVNASNFTQTNNCDGSTLGTNQTCTITVTFASNVVGDFNAVVKITSNSSGTPFVVLLGSAGTDTTGGGGCSIGESHSASAAGLIGISVALLGMLMIRRRRA